MSDPYVLDDADGTRLTLQEYKQDFQSVQWSVRGEPSWKLERCQHFREPGFPSWDAFARGDWTRSLELLEDEREFLEDFTAQAKGNGITLYRVRVVQQPLDPYLHWELHFLKLRAECGEFIRVVTADRLAGYEGDAELPELVTFGSELLYRVVYDDHGELAGAVRFSASEIVTRAVALTRELYDQGEDLESFFEREVAPLPAPSAEAAGG